MFKQAEEALLRMDVSRLADREIKQHMEQVVLQAITPITHNGLVYRATRVSLIRERPKRGVVVHLSIEVETGKEVEPRKKGAMTPRFRQSRRYKHIR